ncbi:hypothetical protein EC501_08570 [Lysinibacillus halotolerans]|uniref:Uncharacterized protein n=1 Tax=Lysinibacillus halotolerans TaxID=1368476 RepID=A0A3M8H9V3_9BACI|nr:hypothetical protein EC501_08570 [Lysinibacillus halotolerans]
MFIFVTATKGESQRRVDLSITEFGVTFRCKDRGFLKLMRDSSVLFLFKNVETLRRICNGE